MKPSEKRYCFFCDGPTDQVEPHHCPLTFGMETTYTLEELIREKRIIAERSSSGRKNIYTPAEATDNDECEKCGEPLSEDHLQMCAVGGCPHR